MPKVCFFSIVSKNYTHVVRTLMDSIEEHYPEADRVVALCDQQDSFDYSRDNFSILSVGRLCRSSLSVIVVAARADAALQLIHEAVRVPRLRGVADGEQAPLQVFRRQVRTGRPRGWCSLHASASGRAAARGRALEALHAAAACEPYACAQTWTVIYIGACKPLVMMGASHASAYCPFARPESGENLDDRH